MSSRIQDLRTIVGINLGAELEKGFANITCRDENRPHCDNGKRIVKRSGYMVTNNGTGIKD